MDLDLTSLESYLKRYIVEYRQQYEQYCRNPPAGGGFPKLDVSPYIYAEQLECFLLNDGVVIFSPSVVPATWYEQVAHNFSLPNNSLAVMRIRNVAIDTGFRTVSSAQVLIEDAKTTLVLSEVDEDIGTFLVKFTVGFVSGIDIKLEAQKDLYYCPHIIRNMGFNNIILNKSKYIPYLEIHKHKESCAWDEKSIYIRVSSDIRRDFTHAVLLSVYEKSTGGGSIGRAPRSGV